LPKKIFFDAERMKYPHTGLYHFCLQLGNALMQKVANSDNSIEIFAPKKYLELFNKNKGSVPLHFWHKYFLPNTNDINVWHATHQDTNYFPFNKKLPVILTIHDLNYYHDNNKNSIKRKIFLNDLQKKVDHSSHLTFISKYTLEDVKKYIDLKDKPTSIIYNGCNIIAEDKIKPMHKNIDTPFLFTIGTITEKKNFHVLPSLLVDNNYRLIIAGITQNENYKSKIIEAAKLLSVEDRIQFTGAIDEGEKYWYYQNCNAFVFPSLAEGFGLPVVEAMHFGKPVFLSTATSLPEIAGDAAYYFQSFDTKHMQGVFINGLKDFALNNKETIVKARAKKFSWEKAAEQYLKIYQSLY